MPITDYVQAQVLAKKVEQIIAECESESEYQTVLNYHDYIVTHTEYGFIDGEEAELSYKAYGALLRGQAVCNGYAEAMELLLLCSGFDTYMAVGNTQDGSHAWNIVNIDGEWYHVDTTYDDPVPDMGDQALHVYLNVNDAIMEQSHSWNKSAYPECVSMDANYYKKEYKEFSDIEQLKNYIIQTISSESIYEVMLSGFTPNQSDFESIMKETGTVSVSWQCYEDGDYSIYRIVFQRE
jgi:transglutaminase/protease-like cytokinesis protein 3